MLVPLSSFSANVSYPCSSQSMKWGELTTYIHLVFCLSRKQPRRWPRLVMHVSVVSVSFLSILSRYFHQFPNGHQWPWTDWSVAGKRSQSHYRLPSTAVSFTGHPLLQLSTILTSYWTRRTKMLGEFLCWLKRSCTGGVGGVLYCALWGKGLGGLAPRLCRKQCQKPLCCVFAG